MSIKNSDNTSSINVDEAFINYQLKIPVVSSLPSIGVNVGDLVYYNGEVYYRDNTQWVKLANGLPPTGAFWEIGGDTLTSDSVIGSLNNYDVILQRNGTEYLRLNNNHMDSNKNLDMQSHWVRSSHVPTSQTDLTNLAYNDSQYLNKNTGGNITGNSTFISNLSVSGFTNLQGSTIINEDLTCNSISYFHSALTVINNKIGFQASNNYNSSLYNNLYNLDGVGVYDGLKINTFQGMRMSIGDYSVSQQTKLTLDNLGAVGVNTETPSARLDVIESATDSICGRFHNNYDNTKAWNGRIVSGVVSGSGPSSTCVIAGNLFGHAHIGGHQGDLNAWRPLRIQCAGSAGVTNGSVFLCEGDGRVGIGTTIPSTKLEVIGDVKCSGNYYEDNYIVRGAKFYGRVLVSSGSASIDTNYINQGLSVTYIGTGSTRVNLPFVFSAGNFPIPQVCISEPSTITNLNISVNIISGSVFEINTFDNSGNPVDRHYYIQFIANI